MKYISYIEGVKIRSQIMYSKLAVKNAYLKSRQSLLKKRNKTTAILLRSSMEGKTVKLPVSELTESQKKAYLRPNSFLVEMIKATNNSINLKPTLNKSFVKVPVSKLTETQRNTYLGSKDLVLRQEAKVDNFVLLKSILSKSIIKVPDSELKESNKWLRGWLA